MQLVSRSLPKIEQAHKAALDGDADAAMKLFQQWEIKYGRDLAEVLSEDGSEFDALVRKIKARQGGDLGSLLGDLHGYLVDATVVA